MNSLVNGRPTRSGLEVTMLNDLEVLDARILSLLQQDSRLSFNKVASRIGISVGTAFNHIKKLEKKGILKGYTILLDSNRIGFSLTTLIMVQVEGGHLLDVEDEISKAPNAVAVYDITGEYDAAVIAKFKDREDLNSFIKKLMAVPHVRRTVTSVVLDVVKEDLQVDLKEAGKQTDSTG
jgi:DNA-binding Lrp family transcriptional regulator